MTTPLLIYRDATVRQVPENAELLRIDVRWYGDAFAKTWDKLAAFDPYFHVKLDRVVEEEEVDVPYGVYLLHGRQVTKDVPGAVWHQTEVRKERQSVRKKQDALAPWLTETGEAKLALEALVHATQTPCPVVYSRWFVYQTAIQQDRSPAGYNDFLGLKTEGDYFKAVGFDAKALERFPLEVADAVANSDVTARRKPRGLAFFGKIGGWLFQTLDVDRPVDRANPLRVVDPARNLKVAAKEELANLPNGLWAGIISNAAGVLQEFAPQNIAFDRFGENNDYNVHTGVLTCLRCHDADGLNDVRPYYRTVLNAPPLSLNVLFGKRDSEEALRVRRLYGSPLTDALEDGRRTAARAMHRCNGWETAKTAKEYARVFEDFRSPVDARRAAAELGVTEGQLVGGLKEYLRTTGTIDPVLATFVTPEKAAEGRPALAGLAAGEPVQYEVWAEAFSLAEFAIRGQVAAQPVEIKR